MIEVLSLSTLGFVNHTNEVTAERTWKRVCEFHLVMEEKETDYPSFPPSPSGKNPDAGTDQAAKTEPPGLPQWEFDKPSEFTYSGEGRRPTPILDAYERSRDPAELERLMQEAYDSLPPRDGPRRNNHKRRQRQKYRAIRVRTERSLYLTRLWWIGSSRSTVPDAVAAFSDHLLLALSIARDGR